MANAVAATTTGTNASGKKVSLEKRLKDIIILRYNQYYKGGIFTLYYKFIFDIFQTYTCSTCGYSTTRRDGLSQHYDSVHLKIKNHQCSLCPYAASQKGTLNRHVKLRHKKKDGAP